MVYNQEYFIFCSNFPAQSHLTQVALCRLSLFLSRFYAQFASHAEWNGNIVLNWNVTLFIASCVPIQWPIESDQSVIATGALGFISFALYLIYIHTYIFYCYSWRQPLITHLTVECELSGIANQLRTAAVRAPMCTRKVPQILPKRVNKTWIW